MAWSALASDGYWKSELVALSFWSSGERSLFSKRSALTSLSVYWRPSTRTTAEITNGGTSTRVFSISRNSTVENCCGSTAPVDICTAAFGACDYFAALPCCCLMS